MPAFTVVAHSRSAEIALRSGPFRGLGEAKEAARKAAQRPDIQDAHVVSGGRVVWVAENRRQNPRFLSKEAMRSAVDGALRRSGVAFMVRTNDRHGMSVTVTSSEDRRKIMAALAKFGIESEWVFTRGKDGSVYRFNIDYLTNVKEQGDYRMNPRRRRRNPDSYTYDVGPVEVEIVMLANGQWAWKASMYSGAEALVKMGHRYTESNAREAANDAARSIIRLRSASKRRSNPARRRRPSMATRAPSARLGWVAYPIPTNSRGNFVERLDVIARLLGSTRYEYITIGRRAWVRRQDR